jgi:hypothetical protein
MFFQEFLIPLLRLAIGLHNGRTLAECGLVSGMDTEIL